MRDKHTFALLLHVLVNFQKAVSTSVFRLNCHFNKTATIKYGFLLAAGRDLKENDDENKNKKHHAKFHFVISNQTFLSFFPLFSFSPKCDEIRDQRGKITCFHTSFFCFSVSLWYVCVSNSFVSALLMKLGNQS